MLIYLNNGVSPQEGIGQCFVKLRDWWVSA